MKKCAECPSSSALAFVLRLSRLAGVAPVSFSSRGLRISRPLMFYSNILVTVTSCIVLFGFALDLLTEPERSVRVRTPTSRVIWVANLSIVILITSVATYRAPTRTMCMIDCLKQIVKIKTFINNENISNSRENFKIVMVILSCIGLWFLIFVDIYGYVIEVLAHGREVRTLLLYSFLYYEYFLVLLVQLQFILTSLKLLSALKLVNDALKQLIFTIDTEKKSECCLFFIQESRNKTSVSDYLLKASPAVPNRVINYANDSLSVRGKAMCEWQQSFRGENRTIRDLCNAYGDVCDVLRHLEEGHGLLLLLILASFFFQLIITPYYLITALYTSTDRISNILLQISWCIYHLLNMFMVVEPCYKTQKEMDKTQVLIFHLMRYVTPTDPMFVDLDIFCRQLHENRPTYTPLGMCTLSRSLTVTIIGAVTTYLVIIFQFRTYESNATNDKT